MPEAPLVSIIVPCFNYGHYLSDTLDSILAQHFGQWECIVVDDGSTDNTAAISEAYVGRDARIRYVHQANAGLSAARNAGLAVAQGRYIQLLDADDGIAPGKLELQCVYLDEHPEADLVYGNAMFFTDNIKQLTAGRIDNPKGNSPPRRTACGEELLALLCRDNIMEVSCALLRRSMAQQVGYFDTDYKSYEDWQFWFRCALAGACFHYLPKEGTETYIRYGHASMMRHLRRMNESGIRIRRFMQAHLVGTLARYNRYRLLKLSIKKIWLSLQR